MTMVSTPSKLPVVTAFGGGHGLAVSLRALRRLTDQLTAVVTVADNGGSSGRLRDEFDILPPGDLRRALDVLGLRFCKLDLMELANSPVTPLATS